MKIYNSFILLLTAAIWGVAFVAQSVAMDNVGPFTFQCARSLIGGTVLLPLVFILRQNAGRTAQTSQERYAARKILLQGGICCGTALCFASLLQQFGLLYTTVGKSGFLTACYILIVPLLGLFFGRKCGKFIWCGVVLALGGLYLLCINGNMSFNPGDTLTLFCAVLFSVQIMLVDYFAPKTNTVAMSCIQFYTGAVISAVGMILWEQPSLSALLAAWKPILYTGALSSGVAYTLQIVGQKGMNPTVASLIMSLESVISVIAGWLILGQKLSSRECIGCILMFAAIVLAQLPEKNTSAA